MRLLVLGGTAWLGGTVAATALREGHEVTCLARGETGKVPAGATHVVADRARPDAYADVAGRDWDAVVDVTRQPGQARDAARALRDRAAHVVLVSSASVYADHATPGQDESAPLLPELDSDVMETMESYGEAKVACERHVAEAFGADRCMVVRAGLIAGPGDTSDRTGYWPLRFARPAADDGSVLVPDAPGVGAQVVDVRDLAAWIVASAAARRPGVFNAIGESMPLAEHLEVAREVGRHDGPLVEVDQEWLLAHDVEPWAGSRSLPLWLPLPEYAGFSTRDTSAAEAAGLVTRPLEDTLADTLAWELRAGAQRPRRAGLSDEAERELIAAARS
jgi:nucleoside-diphosphate-sugar epimerase